MVIGFSKIAHMRYQEAEPYLAVIRKKYPKIRWSDIKVYDQGKRHIVMVVSEYDVFRFPKNKKVARRMEAGVLFANVIRPILPVMIPDQMFVCDIKNKMTYSTYQFLPGVICTQKLFSKFSRAEQDLLAHCIGHCLSVIHSYPIVDAKRLGVEVYNEQKVYVHDFNSIIRDVLPLVDDFVKKWIQTLYRNFFNTLKLSKFQHTLTHFDPKPDHIIVNPKTLQIVGFVDCDEVEIGDPAFDFRKLDEYGDWFLKEVCQHYLLPRDAEFDNRMRFYKLRSPVGTLLSAARLCDQAAIKKAKNRLERYCKSHPL